MIAVLVFTDLTLLFLGAAYTTGVDQLQTVSAAMGFITAFFAYWAGASALWSVTTPIMVPMFPMVKHS
jgi:p-aminobenzoyl-glutamate transporter AbgT